MRSIVSLLIYVTFLTACIPTPSSGDAQADVNQTPPRPARTLAVAIRAEPTTAAVRTIGQGAGVATKLSKRMFNADLAILDNDGIPLPYLAEALPQLNTDTWRVFPDGRMETTYRLKPDLVWHDGNPLSSGDFVFAFRVYATPELGTDASVPINLIEEVVAPDDRTVLIRWKRPYVDAGALRSSLASGTGSIPPLPRSILESTFEAGPPSALVNHSYWTREFVGLGPYRLQRWEPGAFIEGVAFERHALGSPKIERIRLLFMPDSNAVLAAMLAGEVQMSGETSIGVGQVPVLLREWRSSGPRPTAILHPTSWRAAAFQLRAEYATPRALLEPRVRRALAHAIDKPPINEAVYDGQLLIADITIPPTSQVGRAVDGAITKYPFDLRRSEELMTQAGFTRGPDGMYASPTEGRFTTEIKTNAATENEAEMSSLASGWRRAGFDVRDSVLPVALAQDNQTRSTFPGIFSYNTGAGESGFLTYRSSQISRPDNQWIGQNRGGWSNPEYDRLSEAFNTSLDRSERGRLLVEMARLFNDVLPAISLFFPVQPWVFDSALQGPTLVASESDVTWNIHDWQLQ